MTLTIRNIFGLKKKTKKATHMPTKSRSPTASVISFSSGSSMDDSSPNTPTSMSIQENRGIFRTLEPVWYYDSSLQFPNSSEEQQPGWIRFDDYTQLALENSFIDSKEQCTLEKTSLGACTVYFRSQSKRSSTGNTMLNKQRPRTLNTLKQNDKFSSMPALHTQKEQSIGLKLELNNNVRRTISPVWWFEQDSSDGTKGMCRFDYKNQVRLEALSEGRSKLVLTDDGINVPFTVVLDAPKSRQLKEEVRGFLYLEPVSAAFQLAYQFTEKKFEQQQHMENSYPFDDQYGLQLTRRFSI
ncbi:hypothetical protein K501DRAFT_287378 [Backusella circina FSU 941]|nr:hypothetical protein K501DRAFT_287378 [Backusella circina FSU 941]